jgi:hypothetical protein
MASLLEEQKNSPTPKRRVLKGKFGLNAGRFANAEYWADEKTGERAGNVFDKDKWEEVGTFSGTFGQKDYLVTPYQKKNPSAGYGTEDFDSGQDRSLLWGAANPLDELTPEQKKFYGYSNPEPAKVPAAKKDIPAAVAASAAATPAPTAVQKTIAQRQADDIRASGGLTASDQTAQIAASIKDPNSAFYAAMARGGHADAHARNMRVGKYAHFDPDSFIPETVGVKGKGAVTYRERAYGKHFANKPIVEGGDPRVKAGNWVGNNIVTGEFRGAGDDVWVNEGAFRNSERGEAGMVETDERPDWMGPEFSWESKDYDPIADSVRMGGGLPKDPEIGPLQNREPTTGPSKREFTDARLGEFLRARMKGYQAGDHSLDSLTSGQYHDPSFLHFTKGNTAQGRWGDVDPSVGSIYYGNEQDPLFERAASGLTLNPMPETSIEDAVSQRNAFNPSTPKRDFDPISAIRNFGAPPQSREITGRKMNFKRPIR